MCNGQSFDRVLRYGVFCVLWVLLGIFLYMPHLVMV